MQTIEYRYVCTYYDQTNEYYNLCRIHEYLHILRSKVRNTQAGTLFGIGADMQK